MTTKTFISLALGVAILPRSAPAAQISDPQAAQDLTRSIPLDYEAEKTGAQEPPPPLPPLDKLPTIRPLTDPFAWSDGSGRSTNFADWKRRRAEIKAEIEHYEIGRKPARPENINASYADGKLTVNITENGEALTLTAQVILPPGNGPFPAVIGIGRGSGSLPSDIFGSRNIARIAYNFSQIMAYTQKCGQEPINRLYPELTHIGAYSAWSWGVSRLIDGLELVRDGGTCFVRGRTELMWRMRFLAGAALTPEANSASRFRTAVDGSFIRQRDSRDRAKSVASSIETAIR